MHAILQDASATTNIVRLPTNSSQIYSEMQWALYRLWLLRAIQFAINKHGSLKKTTEIAGLVEKFLPDVPAEHFHPEQSLLNLEAWIDETIERVELTQQDSNVLFCNIRLMQGLFRVSSCETQVFLYLLLCGHEADSPDLSSFTVNYTQNEKCEFYAHCLNISYKGFMQIVYERECKYISLGFINVSFESHGLIFGLSVDTEFSSILVNEQVGQKKLLHKLVDLCAPSALCKDSFAAMKEDFDLVTRYLKKGIKKNFAGLNVLLYGPPGSGKTEFAKVAAQELGLDVYLIPATRINGCSYQIYDGEDRLEKYHRVSHILENEKCVVLFDEASDLFDMNPFFSSSPKTQKAGINSILEQNKTPCIWITNNVDSMDAAVVRRFDVVVEFKALSTAQRLLKIKSLIGPIDDVLIQAMATHKKLEVGVIARAHKVASSLHPTSVTKYTQKLLRLINGTLKAQGINPVQIVPQRRVRKLDYNPDLVHIDLDIEVFLSALKNNSSARICCHGEPGTGKSMFARYVAKELNKPIIVKQASDLLGKYVGENEKLIALAFTEAKRKGAILVIDEIDTFISSRQEARQSWQNSMVNEMLVQLESFNGIFFGTTNLLEQLDSAALRRFDLKLEFKSLTEQQRVALLKEMVEELLNDAKPTAEHLLSAARRLDGLTPSDGAVVKRQSRFQPIQDFADLVSRLDTEAYHRAASKTNSTIGFCA